MRRWLAGRSVSACSGPVSSRPRGCIPADKDLAPLAMVKHDVKIRIEDQAAVTRVTQTFRNPTSQQLEATYVFPVPRGAGVKKFVMWVDGKQVPGELVEADKARTIYTDIVRRTQDPGLLEYVGSNLLRLRVFPIPAHGEQKLSVSFTSIAAQEDGLVEYVYPLKAGTRASSPLEKFTLHATLRSQHLLQNVYSPSHSIKVERHDDHEAVVRCETAQLVPDKDFQLYYTHGSQDVELTLLTCRPSGDGDGTFLLLISPRAELSKKQHVARDMVFVLDTSGSMQGAKMEQAQKALKYCLGGLSPRDRFTVMNFATTVNKYAETLVPATTRQVEQAKKWVDDLGATGGTAIDAALDAALEARPGDTSRPFTIVFFTDGQPTIGETDPEKILKKVLDRNTANTRIFTFGVGDDVNAALLDQLADQTRAVSTYVRPAEDIEVKTSGLYGKISHPVLTNLKLTAGKGVTLLEIYPTNLPDLFHGSQLVVLGRYHGHGPNAVTLTGSVGKETRAFVYDVNFPAKTGGDRAFVVDLWARRKVGYLLEQIRSNGENKELVEEVVALAKKHGIATPYTSYLVVPDTATPATTALDQQRAALQQNLFGSGGSAGAPLPVFGWLNGGYTYSSNGPGKYTVSPENHGYQIKSPSEQIDSAPVFISPTMQWAAPGSAAPIPASQAYQGRFCGPNGCGRIDYAPVFISPTMQWAAPQSPAPMSATAGGSLDLGHLPNSEPVGPQALSADLKTGKVGVDLAVQLNEMRNQSQVGQKLVRQAAGRTCVDLGGLWADQGFDGQMKQVPVKAMSAAYFRLLERHPEMNEVFQLGTHVVWVTPSGCALVIDPDKGAETMMDAEIDALFAETK